MNYLRGILVVLAMLMGICAARFAPPLVAAGINVLSMATVWFVGRPLITAFKEGHLKPGRAQQAYYDAYANASNHKRWIARVFFYGGLMVLGVGIYLLASFLRRPEDVEYVSDPLRLGAFLIAGGLLIAFFPRFVLFSK
ncbi:hypothetical protein BH10PSE4_BH10PSE4_16840 [soil metagenome]